MEQRYANPNPPSSALRCAMPPSRSSGRASGEKRSRRGCHTCKVRRKKCPEDFAVRGDDGERSCSSCFGKGLSCRPPPDAATASQVGQPSSREPEQAASRSTVSNVNPAYIHQPLPQSSQPYPTMAKEVALDSSWLDDFFKEFTSLADPIYQDAVWLANATPLPASTHETVAAPISGSQDELASPSRRTKEALNHAGPSAGRSDYERIVESHELDLLLERYSALYEHLWRAVITSPNRDDELTRGIVALSRSSKACRAAAVAICLSYHHIMQRERTVNRRSNLGLSHFLIAEEDRNGVAGEKSWRDRPSTNKACSEAVTSTARRMEWPSDEEGAGLAYKWYRFAADEYGRTGRSGSLEQRLSTLLNLRWTIIALHGCKQGRAYMDEIRSLLGDIGVTTGYMRQTVRQGTLLSLIVQSVLAADIFDAASCRHQRCAIRISHSARHTPASSSAISTGLLTPLAEAALSSEALTQDLRANTLFDYEFTSCLSIGIIDCVLLICHLNADMAELGTVSDIEARKQDILHAIRHCHFKAAKADLQSAASVRAVALHEMWRQSTLIYYYQTVLKLGPLAKQVQDALEQILSLADMLAASLKASEAWDMWMVWFLAGSVAVSSEQRAKCLRFLEGLGSEQALLDNIKVLQTVWRLTDETGNTQDWLSIAEKNGIAICYGF